MIVFVYGTKSSILYKENMMGSRLEGWSQSNYMRVNFYQVKQRRVF